jgi:hypothetical protein
MEAIILTKDQYSELLTKLDTITSQLSEKAEAKQFLPAHQEGRQPSRRSSHPCL